MNCRSRAFVAFVCTVFLLVTLSVSCGGGNGGEGPTPNPNLVPQNYPAIVFSPSLWTQLSPTGTAPTPREQQASVYDAANDRLIIFGGRSSSQCFSDTWVLANASGTTGPASWIPLSTTGMIAPARYAVVAAYNSSKNMLIVFGGVDANGYPGTDLWVLTNANGLEGTTPTWMQTTIWGTAPTARVGVAGTYDEAADTIIFFGGVSFSASGGTLYNETWTIRDVTSTPTWYKLNPAGTLPTARRDASAVYDAASNRLIIFGGNTSAANPPNASGRMNETWVLSNANGVGDTPTWSQLDTLDKPAARSGHTAVFDGTNQRMLVFAGAGTDSYPRNDVWVLADAGETTASWTAYDTGNSLPTPRAHQSVVYTGGANNKMLMFGGAVGTNSFDNDVWVLRGANGIPSTPVAHITIKAASKDLFVGYTLQLVALSTDTSNSEVSGVLYTWHSSNTEVATVGSLGLVTGIGAGKTTITVSSGDVSSQIDITIHRL
jgi:hypothetical protein